jgi:L-alanine-DL-glutamate epimerase-like enolase superfamily enzyme
MIEELEIYTARVPMRRTFGHARHSRGSAESVLVRVMLDGAEGWGEGAPRPYLTGETLATSVSALARLDVALLDGLLDWSSFESAVATLVRLDLPRLLGGRAAVQATAAALEIALLDALCRAHERPLRDALAAAGIPARALRASPAEVAVALVVDLSREPAEMLQSLSPATLRSLRHVKVKAAADPGATLPRLAEIRLRLAEGTRVSLDVNGAWSPQALRRIAPSLVPFGLCWVEEPTTPRAWATMRWLREEIGLGVMLDESCADAVDMDLAVAAGAATHVNIRVSKCGGVLRAAALAARAWRLGLGCQLGVQVGELGPLWAAGRTLAAMLRGFEVVEAGRQDEWFGEALTEPPFSVDRGRYRAAAPSGSGTGIVPARALLESVRLHATWRSGRPTCELIT